VRRRSGRLWGHCCRCSTALSDVRSVERGVGPKCIQILARYIKANAADGPNHLAFMTGLPVEFIAVTIEEGKVEAAAKAAAKAERNAILAAIPQDANAAPYRVDGFERDDHDVRVIVIVDVAHGSNEGAHRIAEAIAGEAYCFPMSRNIDHPVNPAAKNRLFFSEEELFEAAPELRPVSRRRRASR
jgi:hypothetical protein